MPALGIEANRDVERFGRIGGVRNPAPRAEERSCGDHQADTTAHHYAYI
jgi:hypothetical protein